MNQATVIKLLAATVAVLGLAFWASTSRHAESGLRDNGSLVIGLRTALNDIHTVRIIGAGNKTLVTLNKADKGWGVGERQGYPADIEKVRSFLIGLADSVLIEAKTSNPELYAKIGVEDLAGAEAKGLRIELDGAATPVKLIVGHYSSQGAVGSYVRRNDEAQSWLARGSLIPDTKPELWLQNSLADIESSRLRQVEINRGGSKLLVSKSNPGDDKFQIQGIPKGREPKSEYEANGIGSVLSGLRLQDVRKASTDNTDKAELQARYSTFDGLLIHAEASGQGENNWVRFSALLDPIAAEAAILSAQQKAIAEHAAATEAWTAAQADASKPEGGDKSPAKPAEAAPTAPLAVSDPAKDKAERMQALQTTVSELNARFQGWEFQLPPFTFANINRSMDDLLKP
ncbi:MAG: DUF4340 domain-containing protein [Lysobacterales bacterium]